MGNAVSLARLRQCNTLLDAHILLDSIRSRARNLTTVASSIVCFFTVLSTFSPSNAEVIHVPGEHASIEIAVNSANDGDEIHIATGFYQESISISGKSITLRGDINQDGFPITVIDGQNTWRPVHCSYWVGPNLLLKTYSSQVAWASRVAECTAPTAVRR